MFTRLWHSLHRLFRDDRGSSAVEYGIIVAGIAGIIVVSVGTMGSVVQAAYKGYCDSFSARAGISSTCSTGAPVAPPADPPADPPGGGDGDGDGDGDHHH